MSTIEDFLDRFERLSLLSAQRLDWNAGGLENARAREKIQLTMPEPPPEMQGFYIDMEEFSAAWWVEGVHSEEAFLLGAADLIAQEAANAVEDGALIPVNNWAHMVRLFGPDVVPLMLDVLREARARLRVGYLRAQIDFEGEARYAVLNSGDPDFDEASLFECAASDACACQITHMSLGGAWEDLVSFLQRRQLAGEAALRGSVPPRLQVVLGDDR